MPGYDYHSALQSRLALIDDMGQAQNTWAQMQAARAKAKRDAEQQMASLEASYQSQLAQQGNNVSLAGGMSPGNTGGGDAFTRFKNAIASIESGGNYNARNPSGALGKYQIMSGNVGNWSKQALGYSVTPQQFMAPDIQEKVASYHLKRLYDRFGPAGAAVAWYAGEGTATKWIKSNGGGAYNTGQAGGYPSINKYVSKLMGLMG